LATGGTILSVIKLLEGLGGEIVTINFLIELTALKGREKLGITVSILYFNMKFKPENLWIEQLE
jgi:adenine/guanine phosphoribosyltransferase-like PRPP-binding protein